MVRAMVAAVGAVLVGAAGARGQVSYSVQDLGLPAGATSTVPVKLHTSGRVLVYTFDQASGATRSHVWEAGVFTDLGSFEGLGRNEAGDFGPGGTVVVGSSWSTSGFPARAWSWQGGVFKNLGTLGGSYSNAYSMNESGRATGWSYAPSPANFFAFVHDNGAMANLGELIGANNSTGYEINDAGQVSASSAWYLASWSRGAIADLAGGMHDIGTLGGARCFAQAINEQGHITGSSDTGAMNSATEYRVQAFLWRDGVMTGLGVLPGRQISIGRGLNNTGSVVGLSWQGSVSSGFVWRDGVMTELNTMIDPAGGWTLADAVDMTDDGRILCAGVVGGVRRAVVLVPQ